MRGAEVQKIHQEVISQKPDISLNLWTPHNPILYPNSRQRRLAVYCGDLYFGDSGKGSVAAKYNQWLLRWGTVHSIRTNGSANAGHETGVLVDGHNKTVITHQLPVASFQEGCIGINSRGVLLHAEDALREIQEGQEMFGGQLPGELLIDARAILTTDALRAREVAIDSSFGSTGMGVGPGYATELERSFVTLKDLLSHSWKEIFQKHYRLHEKQLDNFGGLANIEVPKLLHGKKHQHKVGSEAEFLDRLEWARAGIAPFVTNNMYDLLDKVWKDPTIPVTFEQAQGPGLDKRRGLSPDYTASSPISRYVGDSVYDIVEPDEIPARLLISKTRYITSVGHRKLADTIDREVAGRIQTDFDEKGKTTGRLRIIYNQSVPIAMAMLRADGGNGLVFTHLDSAQLGETIDVISHYTDKKTGEERPYLPFQDEMDKLEPHYVSFPSWDGQAVKEAKTSDELPKNCKQYIRFWERVTGRRVQLGTWGPNTSDVVRFTPGFD